MLSTGSGRPHHLHAVGQPSLGCSGGKLLGMGRRHRRFITVLKLAGRPERQQSRGFEISGHIGQFEANGLEIG